ncbi:MAG: AsmA family protein, partial [Pseudonocardiaceae bacterium]
MNKIVKYGLIAVGALLGVLVIIAAIVAATFNPNDYKPQIIKLVQEKKQRTLSIPGEIKLTFFPKIGADLGKISISEHKSPATFASIDSARVSLALIPLLSKQLIVDRVKIDGLTANLKRYKDGTTNVDDLLSKDDQQSQQQIKFDIDGVSITNTNIFFDDEMAGRKLELTKVNITTGQIASGKASKLDLAANVKSNNPPLAALVTVKSGFNLDLEQKHYVLNGLDAELKGQAMDFSDAVAKLQGDVDLKPATKQFNLQNVQASLKGKHGAQTVDAQLSAPKFAVTDKQVSGGKISATVKAAEAGKTLEASLAAPSFEGTPQSFTIPSLGLD